MSKWFYDTSTGAAIGAVPLWFFVGGAQIAVELAIREHGGHQDLRGSDRRSVILYAHG
jgi:hypothetical protein